MIVFFGGVKKIVHKKMKTEEEKWRQEREPKHHEHIGMLGFHQAQTKPDRGGGNLAFKMMIACYRFVSKTARSIYKTVTFSNHYETIVVKHFPRLKKNTGNRKQERQRAEGN